MFVGESGVMRMIERTCEVMNELKTDDPERIRAAGAFPLPFLQKYMNFHFSVSVDLFGQEVSTNAANYYTQSLKGRFQEEKIEDDHHLREALYKVYGVQGGELLLQEHPALNAVNERLRDDYVEDCQKGMNRWNKVVEKAGIDYRFVLPHRAFNRRIGAFALQDNEMRFTPDGKIVSKDEYDRRIGEWMPTDEDQAFVRSLMKPVTEHGKMAGWIAPPKRGIHGKPVDYDYVIFN